MTPLARPAVSPPDLPLETAFAVSPGHAEAFDNLTTLVALLDRQGRMKFANTALENALGMSRRHLHGLELAGFFSEPALLSEALKQCAKPQGAVVLRFEAMLRCPNQAPLAVHASVAAAEQGGKPGAPEEIWVELWPLELQARQQREERLREEAQAHKELVRNLAHEIKNPLGGIRGAAQLLQMELQAQPGLAEYTAVIVQEADRLQRLVDRLLAPHRHPQRLGDINIHEVCERVRALVLLEYPQGLSVVQDYDTSIPEFRGDRAQLIQTVLNLVQNAAQALSGRMANDDGACITLRTRVARQVTLGRERHRLALQLHVIDNGPGVPEAIREQIFHPLVSGRDGGTGLGLSLAQTFAQRHHGLIECDSVPGRTDFCLWIPLP